MAHKQRVFEQKLGAYVKDVNYSRIFINNYREHVRFGLKYDVVLKNSIKTIKKSRVINNTAPQYPVCKEKVTHSIIKKGAQRVVERLFQIITG